MALSTNLLSIAIQANVTTILVGEPGIGKTAITKAMVAQIRDRHHGGKGFPFVVINAAQSAPESFGGAQIPNHDSHTMDDYSMGAIKELVKAGTGCLLVDEFGSCSGQTRAGALSIMDESRLFGSVSIPNVSVVACMNPVATATNGIDMGPADLNRLFRIDWEVDHGAWFDWLIGGLGAVDKFPVLPEGWQASHLPKARNLVAMFLKRNPRLIHVLPAPEEQKPWPSNRSWANGAKMFAAVLASGFDMASDEVHGSLLGAVGRSAADEFFAWVRKMDLPDPEQLLANPKQAGQMIPERHDRAMACLESVAAAAVEERKDAKDRWKTAWEILAPVIRTHQDRAIAAGTILANKMPAGAEFPLEAVEILKIRRDMGVAAKKGNQ